MNKWLFNIWAGAKNKVPKFGKNPVIKIIIAFYIGTVAGLILLYTGAWLIDWRRGAATLADLLAIIEKITDANGLAIITFIMGLFIDINGNGIPDILEKNKKDENGGTNDAI